MRAVILPDDGLMRRFAGDAVSGMEIDPVEQICFRVLSELFQCGTTTAPTIYAIAIPTINTTIAPSIVVAQTDPKDQASLRKLLRDFVDMASDHGAGEESAQPSAYHTAHNGARDGGRRCRANRDDQVCP